MALLHHVGVRSGVERVNPLGYFTDGDRIFVVASFGGSDVNPAWYHNLLANPRTTVEIGSEAIPVTARELTGVERDERFIPESLQPLAQRLNAPCVDCVDPSRALGMNRHQSCCLEDLQVLGDCGATHLHPFGDLANGSCAATQTLQHRPPGRISQGIEDSLFVSNHLQ